MGRKVNISKKNLAILLIGIVGFTVFVAVLFSVPSITINRQHEQANVVLFAKSEDSSLITSLQIDSEAINLTVITKDTINTKFNEDLLNHTDVIIIDRYLPTNTNDLHLLRGYINGTNSSLGLVCYGGLKNDPSEADDFNDEQINILEPLLPASITPDYNVSSSDTSDDEYKIQIAMHNELQDQLSTDRQNANVLVKYISWTSSPLISKRMLVPSTALKTSATGIIESIDGKYSILSEWTLAGNGGTVILLTLLIDGYNNPFVVWPYFNYLMYVSVFHTKADFSDNAIESFAEWPYSPIPHLLEIIMWFSMIGVLWVITIYWFLKFRKRSISDRTTEPFEAQKEPTQDLSE